MQCNNFLTESFLFILSVSLDDENDEDLFFSVF